jgi:DNA-binding NarL/FixJ family response regulator
VIAGASSASPAATAGAPQLGGELFLSDATVKSHVARILGKLGLRDRLQAVIRAYESGVVRPGG